MSEEVGTIKADLQHNRELLQEIRDLVRDQNQRIRKNEVDIARVATEVKAVESMDGRLGGVEVAIAGLKTWVAVVGGLMGVGVIVSAVIGVLVK